MLDLGPRTHITEEHMKDLNMLRIPNRVKQLRLNTAHKRKNTNTTKQTQTLVNKHKHNKTNRNTTKQTQTQENKKKHNKMYTNTHTHKKHKHN